MDLDDFSMLDYMDQGELMGELNTLMSERELELDNPMTQAGGGPSQQEGNFEPQEDYNSNAGYFQDDQSMVVLIFFADQ